MQTSKPLSLLNSFLDSDRRLIFIAIGTSVFSGASSALLVGFIGKQFVAATSFGISSILLFLLLLVVSVLTTLYASKVLIEASSTHSYTLRMMLCRRILSTSFEQVEAIGRHRLIAMLTEDLNDIAVAYTNIPTLVTNMTRVFFCVLYLLFIAPGAISITLILCIPVAYVQILLYRRARARLRDVLPIRDKRYRLYGTLTQGLKELLLDRQNRIRFVKNQLDKNAQQFRSAIQSSFMASQYASHWGQSAYFVIIFAMLIAASKGLIDQQTVAAVALVGLFIRSSMNSLLQAIPLWMKASVAVDKMNRLALSKEQVQLFSEENTTLEPEAAHPVSLALNDVVYSYRNTLTEETTTIGPLNLEFRAGELVFITGGNGSGKTTLMKLMTSMYRPESGDIALNHVPLTEETEEWYRQHVQAVFAEFCLVGTLKELFRDAFTEQESDDLLRKFRLPATLTDGPDELDSIELSSGQMARMALLPVFLNDKPIVLFDEWAAHQDPEFKRIFYYQLLPELKKRNKLVVVITHDDLYFDAADRVVVFESGKVLNDPPDKIISAT